ncbi:LemA family protein [Chondromyces apiculatus]|uniref:LemA family protein n=1 Tax=Chondromyces apiculatus DSM 436 TaxID=1192034 RepID=A0A017T7Z2_9BACT|nr:LemA family protein [Chondromyces apiculatus]EYF05364.1 LemA family protein [Chondromyces apiculatus DSM 436]
MTLFAPPVFSRLASLATGRITRPLWAALCLLAMAFAVAGCSGYDDLVEKDQTAAQKWSDLEAALQRRYDLIPSLVETVKGSAKHEQQTLAQVTEARANVGKLQLTADDLTDPAKMEAFQKAQADLKSSLSRLMVIQEQYPDLKANKSFHDLQVQLEGTENRIQRSREEYNQAARDYNTALLKVGGQVVNKVTGAPFKPRVYFTATSEAQVAPKVQF